LGNAALGNNAVGALMIVKDSEDGGDVECNMFWWKGTM